MRGILKNSLSLLTRGDHRQKRSQYYEYAKAHIPCFCPLCHCPFQDKLEYSFVYICESRRFIYYDIPKCASTTIRQILFKNNHNFSLKDPQLALDKYFKFSFVRNPWSRMVSNYRMFTTQPLRRQQLESMTNSRIDSFEKFVHFARGTPNHHWQPQSLYMPDRLDFLGRLESFQADLDYVGHRIGINLKHVKSFNSAGPMDYTYYYTPPLRNVVARLYDVDITAFGYQFESAGGISQ